MKTKMVRQAQLIALTVCVLGLIYWIKRDFLLAYAAGIVFYTFCLFGHKTIRTIKRLENAGLSHFSSNHPSMCLVRVTAQFKVDYVKSTMNDLGLDPERYFMKGERSSNGGMLPSEKLSFTHIMDFTNGLDFLGEDEGHLKLPFNFSVKERHCFSLEDVDIEKHLQNSGKEKDVGNSPGKGTPDADRFMLSLSYNRNDGTISFDNRWQSSIKGLDGQHGNGQNYRNFPYYSFAKNVFSIMRTKAKYNEGFRVSLIYDAFYGHVDFYSPLSLNGLTEKSMKKIRKYLKEERLMSWRSGRPYDTHVRELNRLIQERELWDVLHPYFHNKTFSEEFRELEEIKANFPKRLSLHQRYLLRKFNRLLLHETFPEFLPKELPWKDSLKKDCPEWDMITRRKIEISQESEDDSFFDYELCDMYNLGGSTETVFESPFGLIKIEAVTIDPDRHSYKKEKGNENRQG